MFCRSLPFLTLRLAISRLSGLTRGVGRNRFRL